MSEQIRYILGDTETTDSTDTARVCEIAWVELNEDLQVIDRQHSLIDPQVPIGASASGVHGITDSDIVDSPTIDEFFQIVLGRRLTGNVMLIAHKVAFDKRFFAPYIDNLVEELCTLRLARRLFPDAPDHKLPTLKYYLKLPKTDSHSADGDVEQTLELLRLCAKEADMTLPQLATFAAMPILVETMPFGKHKGLPLKQVPNGYKTWLLGQTDVDPDLVWSLQQR